MTYEDGRAYWISFPDGSRVKAVAHANLSGEVDFVNHEIGFFLWKGALGDAVVEVAE